MLFVHYFINQCFTITCDSNELDIGGVKANWWYFKEKLPLCKWLISNSWFTLCSWYDMFETNDRKSNYGKALYITYRTINKEVKCTVEFKILLHVSQFIWKWNINFCRQLFNKLWFKLNLILMLTNFLVLGNQSSASGLLMSHEVKNAWGSGTKFLMTQTYWWHIHHL